ncbi:MULTISPECIES: ROK family protein [Butyricimonas]|uniref:ROK family protein n=1 Tax=Butyricimonas TaxID=574697 RepID=UPI0007FB3A6B|nr:MULTISPECIES: ROK family protein [Butyricimonas]
MYQFDKRIVMTLDAGGTNFVFSAIQSNEEIVEPLTLPSNGNDLERCLATMVTGFSAIRERLADAPVAISFAFPGPADYVNGIIGDLKNLPAFQGGVALKAFLEREFGIPVFINNDGDLFAYGEALAGALPEVNRMLQEAGKGKVYKNLIGITLGTGFGGGVVRDRELFLGDNGAAAEVWVLRDKREPRYGVEEGISIRAIRRGYARLSGDERDLTPRDIFDIAEGTLDGDREAAREAFARAGEVLGEAIASMNAVVDGVIVIGGGIVAAHKYLMPAVMRELNGSLCMYDGSPVDRMEMKAFFLDDPRDREAFLAPTTKQILIPGTTETVDYDPVKRAAVLVTRLGTSKAIAFGAYAFALNELDRG